MNSSIVKVIKCMHSYHLFTPISLLGLLLLFETPSLQAGIVTNQRTGRVETDLQKAIDEARVVINDREHDILELKGSFTGSFTINKSLTLKGMDMNETVIQGDGTQNSVLSIHAPNKVVIIRSLTIQDGNNKGGKGGGIYNNADLKLSNVRLQNNIADVGGGIFSISEEKSKRLEMGGCVISNNRARLGAGIAIEKGGGKFIDTLVEENHARDLGGGGYLFGHHPGNRRANRDNFFSNYILENTTISKNTAADGGGLYVRGNVKLLSNESENGSKVEGNSAIGEFNGNNVRKGKGGGIYLVSDETVIIKDKNSMIINNDPNNIFPPDAEVREKED